MNFELGTIKNYLRFELIKSSKISTHSLRSPVLFNVSHCILLTKPRKMLPKTLSKKKVQGVYSFSFYEQDISNEQEKKNRFHFASISNIDLKFLQE